MPRLLISAAHKSSGKTTVTIGLCAALARRGLTVQPFKKGPDYIDPMWHGVAAGRTGRNLDFNNQGPDEIVSLFLRCANGADVAMIEGNKGLHDGVDLHGSDSSAALAKLLGAPVVLVVDAAGITRGVAPLLLGYQAFDRGARIGGVILNKVSGPRHESKLRAAIEAFTDLPVIGAIRRSPDLAIVERHLGLIPSNEMAEARAVVSRISDGIAAQCDLEAIMALARTAGPLVPASSCPRAVSGAFPSVRIGIARDAAFGFYYPDDVEALAAGGAELVPIDTLRDTQLPPGLDGLFIGGGFPESHMEVLEANRGMRDGIRAAILAGLPVYAECGGLMYLSRSIVWKGRTHAMVGAISGDTVMHDRPRGKGFVRLRETGHLPWPGTQAGAEITAHEFHYSSLENLSDNPTFAYDILRGDGIDGHHDGIVVRNVVATYAHMRSVERFPWSDRFVSFVRACRKERSAA
ncbi:MAG: cobyrinate a,c-diamide synthase [Alphaproteobacteria bacterium]|nr:cobyrinate a,c-diamide synthase [Alphaproteobacteria bacterium]